MTHYFANIKEETLNNTDYRRVLFTSHYSQLVVMSLKPNQEIGFEVHYYNDQFIRIESGTGKAIIAGTEHILVDDSVVIIPANTLHNIINTSKTDHLKLYTIYSPPNHEDKLIENIKIDGMKEKCFKYLHKNKLIE